MLVYLIPVDKRDPRAITIICSLRNRGSFLGPSSDNFANDIYLKLVLTQIITNIHKRNELLTTTKTMFIIHIESDKAMSICKDNIRVLCKDDNKHYLRREN